MSLDVESLLSPGGPIARRLKGFESRPQQIEMAAAVEGALEQQEGGRLLVEAGTGVGKSFAYLIPAIKRIVEHRERVVVVTNTINLQEQLIEKDIPLLSAVFPDEFSAVLVKGRGNYVSLRRLKLASERQERLITDEEARHSLHLIEDWAYSTRDGTLATLPRLPRPEVWDFAQSDAHNCMGRKCPTYDKCFYQAARRRMENGDLLVCNHALFFSDLALRSNGVGFLPPYIHVILDEAHSAEEVAAEHFGVSLSKSRVRHLLRLLHQPRTGRGFLSTMKLKEETRLPFDAIDRCGACGAAMEQFFNDLIHWQSTHGPVNGRIKQPDIVENPLTPAMKELSKSLRLLRDNVANEADQYELNSYAQRAEDIAQDVDLLLRQAIEGCVYFLEGAEQLALAGSPVPSSQHPRSARGGTRGGYSSRKPPRARGPARVALKCVAVDVAPILRDRLFGQPISVIMTSATLATGPGDFSHIARRLGCESAPTLQLGSPFDHAAQMRVIIDRTMPEPSHPKYVERLVPRIEQLIRATDGGAFVLFTSFAMLDRVAEALRPKLAEDGYPVLAQGQDGPSGLLLKRFRDDAKGRSVLLGTNSFWQGVDVRGRGLRNVIITRLPFEVPDRPLVEARHEQISARGGNPFVEDQIPRAVIRFKQGVGRLIRSTTDEGVVAVLDPRIVTKPYGRTFLNALPEGVRVQELTRDDEFDAERDTAWEDVFDH